MVHSVALDEPPTGALCPFLANDFPVELPKRRFPEIALCSHRGAIAETRDILGLCVLRQPLDDRVKKALDLHQIAVWIVSETMVDLVGRVDRRRPFK